MKARVFYVAMLVLVLVGVAVLLLRGDPVVKREAAAARRTLRQEGFKTELGEFDFRTDPETAARAASLNNFRSPPTLAVLFQPCGTDCAMVAWKGEPFKAEEEFQRPTLPGESLEESEARLESACAAAMAGPIRVSLDASRGSSMLLGHLPSMRSLSQELAARMVLELRQGHRSAAWTNLMAVTRLATAWEPEPVEVSHLVRFKLTQIAWETAWQALQARNWSEEQLAALQREWEAADFFRGLPEIPAFERASAVDSCVRFRQTATAGNLTELFKYALRSPGSVVSLAKQFLAESRYKSTGTYQDETDLLFFYRTREREWKRTVTARSWAEMRTLPGVVNSAAFQSRSKNSPVNAILNMRGIALAHQLEGKGLLGRAAESEARRRLVVAAIAAERYRIRKGTCPESVAALAPEILKEVPIDFMDGNPLRYRLDERGGFLIHSVGLDCVDNGGRLSITTRVSPYDRGLSGGRAVEPDIVWPRAASTEEAQAFILEKKQRAEEQHQKMALAAEVQENEAEALRQRTIEKLAALYSKGEALRLPDPKIDGRLLSEILRNRTLPGPSLRLEQMLTLRQITTGKEPDLATFELPISYEALTNIGNLRLLCDSDPDHDDYGREPEFQECERGTNGNCLLVWDTTHDPPGRHFLQAELSVDRWRAKTPPRGHDDQEIALKGPLYAFVSTNTLQFLPLANLFSEKGAFFQARLARPVGSYSIKISDAAGKHIHTISGSTTNGIVRAQWDLLYDGTNRYTGDRLGTEWTVTFPDSNTGESTNAP